VTVSLSLKVATTPLKLFSAGQCANDLLCADRP
jgi:hypothetical protein